MERISLVQLPPPSDWQNFERFCRDLWSELLSDPKTQRNGRSGQPQHGVDVYGVDLENKRWGIQCKGKDNYASSSSIVSTDELEEEISKALKFSPPIHHFILATTGPKDSKIETRARQLSAEHAEAAKFTITVMGWSDIVERLEKHPEILKKYYSFYVSTPSREEEYFKIWSNFIDLPNLAYNCNFLPFSNFNVKFSGHYINTLHPHILKSTHLKSDPYWTPLNQNFLKAIDNFDLVIRDLVATCYQYENRIEIDGTVTYWIEDQHLEYHQRGDYIQYRKNVLLSLFYQTIKSANLIIKTYNSNLKSHQEPYIGFIRDYNYNFPLLGSPFPSPEEFPMYSDDDLERGNLYEGLIKTDYWVRDQIYKN